MLQQYVKRDDDSKKSHPALAHAPHARHLAIARADAGDRMIDRLQRGRHVEGGGVNHRALVARDRDVPLPEDEIAAPARPVRRKLAEGRLLHVGVAWTGEAAGGERDLHEAGAIEAEAGLAAPEIRRAEEALGDGHEIGLAALDGGEVLRRHVDTGSGEGAE